MSWRLLLPLAVLHSQHTAPPPPPLLDLSSSYYPQSIPPPSSSFPYSDSSSPLIRLFRRLTLTLVHGSCVLHQRFNSIRVLNPTALHDLLHRPPHVALLTLSNHVSTIDDPWVLSAITPWPVLTHPTLSRWSWCTEDICFLTPPRCVAFRLGKIPPIHRGAGLYQEGMTEALSHLYEGEWLHIFPEGRCCPHMGMGPQPLKWGAAKLVVQALGLGREVRVLPIMHAGMEEVLPLKGRVPRVGKEVWVCVGEEVDVRGIVERWRQRERENEGWGDPWPPREEELYEDITRHFEAAMRKTGEELSRRIHEEPRGQQGSNKAEAAHV